ncbi:lytic murein transglycosylase B [Sulfurovum sp. bin170]|uniref:lytic murein transglycosylase B n=1 Tax=Sulfurovum sp. bin170 TaxID=2695268 RepID=UPI0013E07B38|nr:lytic murein transglycosylase B [Sulfurovum sp. bin170]NEW60693.1 lytic murein transglycosylase B [Sulfurovum sp. bin170]
MKISKISTFTLSLLLLSACSTKSPEKKELSDTNQTITSQARLGIDANRTKEPIVEVTAPTYDELHGEFQTNHELLSFIDMMVNVHSFKRDELNRIFSQAQNFRHIPQPRSCSTDILRIQQGKWDRYKSCFIYENNIQRGIDFWEKHKETLERAEMEYGVPAEYIVGIVGIETAYGTNFGKHRVIDVLTTKSMLGHRRANFYRDELENFLILTRDAGLSPTELMGSTSGALGYGQFIPSSYIRFAIDFNGDGATDLWNAEDAIGSIANYFSRNGWKSSISQVAVRAKYKGQRFRSKKLKTGYKHKYSQYKLRKKYKIKPRSKLYYRGPVSLIDLPRATYDELWFGTHNFRVITTYNHSSFYAMAVYQLAQAVKDKRG